MTGAGKGWGHHDDTGHGQPRPWEDVVCTGIVLTLGAAAGAGSFVHVRDVAAGHGQGGWISYAIAGSVDLMAVGSGLEIRRRRRLAVPARWPIFTLLPGVAMTLAANLATVVPGWWGAAVAVWPAAAFLAVAGLFETRSRPPVPAADRSADRQDRDTAPGPGAVKGQGDEDRSGEDQEGEDQDTAPGPVEGQGDEDQAAVPVCGPVVVVADEAAAVLPPPVPEARRTALAPDATDLLLVGRAVAADLARDGRALTRAALVDGLRSRGRTVSTTRATELLRQLRVPPTRLTAVPEAGP